MKNEPEQLRYFFASTIGQMPDGRTVYNSFCLDTNGVYPSKDDILRSSNKLTPGQKNTAVISIAERSKDDQESFINN